MIDTHFLGFGKPFAQSFSADTMVRYGSRPAVATAVALTPVACLASLPREEYRYAADITSAC